VLRRHARDWLAEWSQLGELAAELEELEADVRERMKQAMQRASSLGGPTTHQPASAQASERYRCRLLRLRGKMARRDVLQIRQDLTELARARKRLDCTMRDALARARRLEALLGEPLLDGADEERMQQIG
jgi:hypothetical protein